MRVELEQRVERQELDAGHRVDLVGRQALEDRLHDAVGTAVTVVVGVLEQAAVLGDERVIATPGVDANAVEGCRGQALERPPHLQPQPEDVPLQTAALPYGVVWKPVQLPDVEQAVVQPPENGAAAFRAEIERQKLSAHSSPVSHGAKAKDTLGDTVSNGFRIVLTC